MSHSQGVYFFLIKRKSQTALCSTGSYIGEAGEGVDKPGFPLPFLAPDSTGTAWGPELGL